jgi:ATP-dependent Lon protease
VRVNESLTLPLLPLEGIVVLPGMVVPLSLEESETRAAIEAAQLDGSKVLLVPRENGKYPRLGTVAVIEQVGRMRGGEHVAVVRGTGRARIGTGSVGAGAALWVEVESLPEDADETVASLAREYRTVATSILQQRGAWQFVDSLKNMEDPAALADLAGYAPYLTRAQKIYLLETTDVADRLRNLLTWSREHLAELDVAETIRKDVAEGMEKQQREFLLRQQLAAVRKELAELTGTPATEEQDYRARVEAADLPEKVREAALAEVEKLERTSDSSPEVGWIRTWLDTILALPWNDRSEDAYDLLGARSVLDADHAGLSDVKDRIVEYLAVRRRRAERGLGVVGGRRSGAVLALVGPPGVGKTSLGESVARAMGRKFVRVALGGVRDEAEIRGHRRTYVGALPGRIARALQEAGSMNPVMLLDEVDKVGADYRGDPTAALLEVLDPAQNHTFRDHYLEVELDLSDVLFLATANTLESIPGPLLDRMELIRLDGYTEEEKVLIARDHLMARQIERAGLTTDDVSVTDAALHRLAGEYTREAGVRDLERQIARVLRKLAARPDDAEAVTVDAEDLPTYLGRPRHLPEPAERTVLPGVATGLAVTGAGGDVLFVEASLAEVGTGSSGVTITGQLGEVMKESAQIALSFLRANGAALGLPTAALEERGVHIHVPAGAVPKDGPSAGVTMTTALASLLSGRPVRPEVAMTGEVSLTGRVLPIGGVKQKLLAADRAGITTVLIPARNEPDLDDVPEEVRNRLTIHPVGDVRDVLRLALSQPEAAAAAA